MNLDQILMDHRLYFDSHYEEVASLFCNLEGAKKFKTKERYLLSSWYEGYLYTVLLGIRSNEGREKRKGKSIEKTAKWSPYYLKQYKYVLTNVFARKDVIHELHLDTRSDIGSDYTNVKDLMSKVKKICDEYSNGGLAFLQKLYDDDNTIFNDHDCLKKIMLDALK